jgi:hypothetical protein
MFPSSSNAAPQTLRPQTPYLVYLDLNKWIDLAHAASGTKKGQQHEATLRTATELVREGVAIFPLSSAHFMEVAKIGSDSQRRTLAQLMVMLSQGWFLSSSSFLIHEELRRAIASQLNHQAAPGAPTSVLTRNIKEAIANPESIDGDEIVTALLSQSPWMLEDLLATGRVGPSFLNNWRRFADEHEAGRALRSDLTKEMRKRAYCVVVTMGIQDRLGAALSEFGLTMAPVMDGLGPDGCIALLEAVPFLDVEINLHVERNEHHDRPIQPNDEIDLGFLSIAIPYCHAVVTEKFWTNLARRLRLDRKYKTHVCSDLAEALAMLSRPPLGSHRA